MHRVSCVARSLGIVGAAGAVICAVSSAGGHSGYVSVWRNAYPSSTLTSRMNTMLGRDCYVCHQPPNTSLNGNCYKDALAGRLAVGRTITQAIADIDQLDSDGDGVSNHDEILAVRADMPTEVGYSPGLVESIGRDPCADTPNAPVTNVLETPPPAPMCLADFNHDGQVSSQDFFDFLAAFFGNLPAADVNHDGAISSQDFFDFLGAFFVGC